MIRYFTAGESHGQALVGILEGLPAGLELSAGDIDRQLARRQMGFGRSGRMKIESDRIEILSGVRLGRTIGSPIALVIRNRDWENWSDRMAVEPGTVSEKVTLPRPGHADLAGVLKYGFDDIRPVIERSSARETAMRVALGSIARKFLSRFGITIASHVVRIGEVCLDADARIRLVPETKSLESLNDEADASPVRCLDGTASEAMVRAIQSSQQDGDSLGGVFEVLVDGLPPGLGSYTHWDRRLDGVLLQHIGSIQAIKGVEIGDAFDNAALRGSEVHDEIFHDPKKGFYRKTNRCGGLEGGVTTGQRLVIRAAMKPIPTLARPLASVDIVTKEPAAAHRERTDTCSVPAASVVAEAMTALALVSPFLEKFGGDCIDEILRHRDAMKS
jgi:chorismate synthase